MREFERWRDRVELSLDGRQIFFLFFGSAVAACLIFVAGVYVGRRLEARNAPSAAADDPLAALDQLDEEPDDGLTFHDALVAGDKRAARERKPGRPEHVEPAPAAVEPRAPAAPAPKPHAEPPRPHARPPSRCPAPTAWTA